MLQKGVYIYEYIDDSEKFNETSLPKKETFYSCLHMQDITHDADAHTKRVCKNFQKRFRSISWFLSNTQDGYVTLFFNTQKLITNTGIIMTKIQNGHI